MYRVKRPAKNTDVCSRLPNNMTTQTLNNKIFNHMITKCYNKNACGSKITMREGDRKQEIYIWWSNVQTKGVKPTWQCTYEIYGSGVPQVNGLWPHGLVPIPRF